MPIKTGHSDIHCHVLPKIDDGSRSWAESLGIVRQAYLSGIRRLFATPHFKGETTDATPQEVEDLTQELRDRVKELGPDLQIYSGCEAMLTLDLPSQFSSGEFLTLANTNFILIELPFLSYPPYTEDIIFQLMLKGAGLILAHPERNAILRKDIGLLKPLVDRGVYLQINAGSVTGVFGKEVQSFVYRILKEDMVHFLGSDAHRAGGLRGPDMGEALKEIQKLSPRSTGFLDYIEGNVDRLLEGKLP